MMSKEKVFDLIWNWEQEMGEDFLDYFDSDFNAISFMMWARGKGYISVGRFNKWEKAMKEKSIWNRADTSVVVYNCHDSDVDYAVIDSDDWNEALQRRAYEILSEFISESLIYSDRFEEFLEENPV